MKSCTFCGKELSDENNNRGFCNDCLNEIMKDSQRFKNEILDKLDLPVLVFNRKTTTVENANQKLLNFVNKSLNDIRGSLGGNVLDCIYASKPGGCGKTEFCPGCPIRDIVEKTIDEEGHKNKEVSLILNSNGRKIKTNLNISTKVKSDNILFQINDYEFLDWEF